ncbi:MAG TPA: hypothetical protein VHF05_02210 [Candidatus Paceibacterota bacterium]|jgi:hypothetical protein|nr:hypothetical protein [Candidatus Paceibacterota bacterium]
MFESFANPGTSRQEDACVLLDIGNGSVGGSIVLFARSQKPKIVYSVRYPIHIPEKPSSAHLLEKMTRLLEDVVKDLTHEGSRHLDFKLLNYKDIKHVFCIFSSPWYASKTKIFRIEHREPVPVTDEFVKYLLDKEAESFEKSIGGTGTGTLKFIEQKVIRTRLNGYDTKAPHLQAARKIELGVFMSMVPQAVLDRVSAIVSRYFNARHIEFNSFALMSFSLIEDLFPGSRSYMFLDVTSEVTELALVRNNLITDTISIPSGKNLIMRAIARRYGVSPDIAATYMKLYANGHAEKSLKKGIEAAIETARAAWTAQFEKAVKEVSKGHAAPSRVFLTADDDVAIVFKDFIGETAHVVEGRPEYFSVTPLNKGILAHFCTFGRGSDEDSFLAIESVYFNKIFHLEA